MNSPFCLGARASQSLPLVAGALIGVALLAGAAMVRMPLRAWLAEPVRMMEHAEMGPLARPATVVTPVACTPLPDVAGKSITTALVYFPPSAFTPEHRHPGSVTAYVLSGAIRSQLAGAKVETYSAGQTWFEPPGIVHDFAENASSTQSANLLATFVADGDCGPLTIFN
ncbi:cupin domain-containing protein [Aureimonas pseudogalii]|uniref:Quercetin dioxygenase-like cupin family protein n=1 Tax=Aureimonas pseudogalii TaxID=1744844 RepID=A0A7W6H8E9_9HYPH|nr:cupin domain-containing protein [Aureimonas pseudogalii]MBB4000331.1 quercetin dioxygenase-like cupin family protein [Aureimonas pseudogalii]